MISKVHALGRNVHVTPKEGSADRQARERSEDEEGITKRRDLDKDHEQEDVEDEAVNDGVFSDFKRGKRFRKLMRMLGSAQVNYLKGFPP